MDRRQHRRDPLPPGCTKQRAIDSQTHARYTLYLWEEHGMWLNDLAQDYQLVWCTLWWEQANSSIGRHIGLPVLPVHPVATNPMHCSRGVLQDAPRARLRRRAADRLAR